MKRKPERTSLNSEGDFYVEKDTCLHCCVPASEVPELIGFDDASGCYFKRQPQTPEELERAVEAVWMSCVEALRYAGEDPAILERLRARGCKPQCDALR